MNQVTSDRVTRVRAAYRRRARWWSVAAVLCVLAGLALAAVGLGFARQVGFALALVCFYAAGERNGFADGYSYANTEFEERGTE